MARSLIVHDCREGVTKNGKDVQLNRRGLAMAQELHCELVRHPAGNRVSRVEVVDELDGNAAGIFNSQDRSISLLPMNNWRFVLHHELGHAAQPERNFLSERIMLFAALPYIFLASYSEHKRKVIKSYLLLSLYVLLVTGVVGTCSLLLLHVGLTIAAIMRIQFWRHREIDASLRGLKTMLDFSLLRTIHLHKEFRPEGLIERVLSVYPSGSAICTFARLELQRRHAGHRPRVIRRPAGRRRIN